MGLLTRLSSESKGTRPTDRKRASDQSKFSLTYVNFLYGVGDMRLLGDISEIYFVQRQHR